MSDDFGLTMDIPRGCGDDRDEGDLYLCTGTSKKGFPAEFFIVDPAKPITWERGYKLIPINGNPKKGHHVIIFVGIDAGKGGQGYQSAWSFLKEGAYGISRKVGENFPWEMLSPGESKMFFAHRRAIPEFEYELNRRPEGQPMSFCKRLNDYAHQKTLWKEWMITTGYHMEFDNAGNPSAPGKCANALQDLACLNHFDDEALNQNIGVHTDDEEWFDVEMPGFNFTGKWPLAIDGDLNWSCGVFMWSLITHVEIPVSDKKDKAGEVNKAGYEAHITGW